MVIHLLPFLDVLGVAQYLLEHLKDVPRIRAACAGRGSDIPENFSGRIWIILNRFLELSEDAKKTLSEQHLSLFAGKMAICFYFTRLDAQKMYDVMDDISTPHYRRMRDVSDEQVEALVLKLRQLIHLMKVA